MHSGIRSLRKHHNYIPFGTNLEQSWESDVDDFMSLRRKGSI